MATAGAGRGPGPERAWLPEIPPPGAEAVLAPAESAHLVRSRRLREGAPVALFDGRGGSALGRLVRADPAEARVLVEGPQPDREPARAFDLAVSPPDGTRADDVVLALAELGARRLVWLLAERTPAGRGEGVRRRGPRFDRLVREAAKVNGRSRFLEVLEPRRFPDLVRARASDAVVLDPDAALPPLPALLPPAGPLPIVLVGPEGGFSDAEVEGARAAGARRARLGATALRTDTAAIAAAAVLAVAAS